MYISRVSGEAKKKYSKVTTKWDIYTYVAPLSNSQKHYLSRHESYRLVNMEPQHSYYVYRINKPRMEEISATISKYQTLQLLWSRCATIHNEPPFPATFAH